MLLFPFGAVPQASKIILYGAGDCGKQFFRQIIDTNYCKIVCWVDQNAKAFANQYDRYGCTFPVSEVESIRTVDEYDYVVIAIVKRKISANVKEMLFHDYGIPKEKIVTLVHRVTTETVYSNYQSEYQNLLKDSDRLEYISPIETVNSNELSIMPRYLVCRDIVNHVFNEANMSLYKRTILAQRDIFTEDNYFSIREKHTAQDFIKSLEKLVESMQKNDFERRNYIPVVHGNRITLDGQHRIATALAMEKDIWVRHYPDSPLYGDGFGFEWFQKNGFNTEDKLRILRAYADLYPNCGIMIFFGTVLDKWEFMQAQFEKECKIVGYVDLDFSKNYLGFENIIREVYQDPLWQNVQIHLKTKLLKLSPLKLRVILVSDEQDTSVNIYQIIRNTKLKLREALSIDSEPNAGVAVHASDSFEEFILMRNILLSPNNINTTSKCTFRNYRQSFIDNIFCLRAILAENGIRNEDAIIVGGSVLEVFGLRNSDDLDVAVKSKYRKTLGTEAKKWSDNIDLCRQDNVVDENGTVYQDDILIDDDNFHFLFFGMKFINMELLRSKKKHDARKKDLEDIRLIDMFFEYAANFDDKYVLRQQIDRELYLRRF